MEIWSGKQKINTMDGMSLTGAISSPTDTGLTPPGVRISLMEEERLHILHPQFIVAFQGESDRREDRLLNLKGMYRKRKLIRSDISGPAQFLLALPTGYTLTTLPVESGNNLLFEFRNLLFYTPAIEMKTVVLKIKNMLVTRDIMKMKFSGSGALGVLSLGSLYEMKLSPDVPLFVDTRSLVAYPDNAVIDLSVYGNHLASQHMNYQWKITGTGSVLLQTGKSDPQLEADMENSSLIKRILREAIPFGGVFIK